MRHHAELEILCKLKKMIAKLGIAKQPCYLGILQGEAGGLLAWAIELGPLSKDQEREKAGGGY